MKPDAPLQQFLDGIKPVRSKIRKLILFGSRARGDEKPYSDYDLLVVVDKREPQLRSALYRSVVDVLTSTGRVVSLKIFPEVEFKRLSSIPTPFMKNVLAEGQSLG